MSAPAEQQLRQLAGRSDKHAAALADDLLRLNRVLEQAHACQAEARATSALVVDAAQRLEDFAATTGGAVQTNARLLAERLRASVAEVQIDLALLRLAPAQVDYARVPEAWISKAVMLGHKDRP